MIATPRRGRRVPNGLAGLAGPLVAVLLGPLMAAAGGTTLDVAAEVAAGVAVRAAYAGACSTTSSGVTMVVDFSAFGQGVQVSCVPGDPGTGRNALESVYPVVGTTQSGGALVCHINSLPNTDCHPNPPVNAYWAYWHADRGGSWTFSEEGASTYQPKQGTVEGWAFGAKARPGIAPPAAPPPPAPPPPPPPPPGGGSGTTTTTRPPSGGSGRANPTAAQPVTSAAATSAAASADTSTSDPPTPTATATATADPSPSLGQAGTTPIAAPPADAGTPVGTLVGIGLVILLAAAGTGTAVYRRRRQANVADPPPSD